MITCFLGAYRPQRSKSGNRRQQRQSKGNRDPWKPEARNVQVVLVQDRPEYLHRQPDSKSTDTNRSGGIGGNTLFPCIDQSSDHPGVDAHTGQGIGLSSIHRKRSVLHILLFLFLLCVSSFAQSSNPSLFPDEESLLKALLAVKSEDESKPLLRANTSLITEKLWERFKDNLIDAYRTNDSSRSLFLYRIEKQMAEETNDIPRLAKVLDKTGQVYLWI